MIGSCNRSTMSYDYFPLQVPLPTPSVTNAFEPERSDTQQRVHRQPCSNSIPNHRDFVVPPKGSLELRVIEVGRCNPRPVSTQISCRDVLLTVNVCPRTSVATVFFCSYFLFSFPPTTLAVTVMSSSPLCRHRHRHTVVITPSSSPSLSPSPSPSCRRRHTATVIPSRHRHCKRTTAGRRVHELFKRRALTTIANDVVVDFGLRLLTFSASFIYVFVALTVFIASISHGDNEDVDMVEVVSSLICLLFGWVACLLFVKTSLEVFRSGFKTVFVCFVQVGCFCRDRVLYAFYTGNSLLYSPSRFLCVVRSERCTSRSLRQRIFLHCARLLGGKLRGICLAYDLQDYKG